jgi:hypothetical protein
VNFLQKIFFPKYFKRKERERSIVAWHDYQILVESFWSCGKCDKPLEATRKTARNRTSVYRYCPSCGNRTLVTDEYGIPMDWPDGGLPKFYLGGKIDE